MKDIQAALRSRLEKTRDFAGKLPSRYHYRNPYGFVLQEGRFFEPRPLPNSIERGAPRECFYNAWQTAIINELSYVEGYAVRKAKDLPVLHAWNLDTEGFVIDTTWEAVGVGYFGVILPQEFAPSLGTHSAIDNWESDFPMLRNSWQRVVGKA